MKKFLFKAYTQHKVWLEENIIVSADNEKEAQNIVKDILNGNCDKDKYRIYEKWLIDNAERIEQLNKEDDEPVVEIYNSKQNLIFDSVFGWKE